MLVVELLILKAQKSCLKILSDERRLGRVKKKGSFPITGTVESSFIKFICVCMSTVFIQMASKKLLKRKKRVDCYAQKRCAVQNRGITLNTPTLDKTSF